MKNHKEYMIKHDLARITIDLPLNVQKKLKTIAALEGKSMREIVIESVEKKLKTFSYEKCTRDHTPNAETKKTIEEAREGKGLHTAGSAKELFKLLDA